MTFLCLYISRWWRQTWDTAPYFTVFNQSEAIIEHGISVYTCMDTWSYVCLCTSRTSSRLTEGRLSPCFGGLEIMSYGVGVVLSLRALTCASAAVLSMCLLRESEWYSRCFGPRVEMSCRWVREALGACTYVLKCWLEILRSRIKKICEMPCLYCTWWHKDGGKKYS